MADNNEVRLKRLGLFSMIAMCVTVIILAFLGYTKISVTQDGIVVQQEQQEQRISESEKVIDQLKSKLQMVADSIADGFKITSPAHCSKLNDLLALEGVYKHPLSSNHKIWILIQTSDGGEYFLYDRKIDLLANRTWVSPKLGIWYKGHLRVFLGVADSECSAKLETLFNPQNLTPKLQEIPEGMILIDYVDVEN